MSTKVEYEETVSRVLEALDSIRPFLQNDGGDIELIEVTANKVFVRLLGNCSGCAVSFSTMKLGVENTIKQYASEIEEVHSVEE